MAINFNTDPYYDDYSDAKGFHRILFKPGVAVQARELNQLQTILQNQISRFGNHVFKPGSMVIPGNIKFDQNFNYVKLLSTYNSADIDVNNYLDREMIGQTSGIRAKVMKVEPATAIDPPTLFVKYLDSGTSRTETAFTTGETIVTDDAGTVYYATLASTSPTGKCLGASISDGVYFVKDNFVKVFANTIILDKYLINSNYRVGLEVSETIKNSDDDETLLDPAISTFNYFAPGADRYKIELILSKRPYFDTTESDNFIELLRVIYGKEVNLVDKPGYNILADELARRTFDESGDYTVKPFNLKFIEHAATATNLDGYIGNAQGNANLSIAILTPGKSYVKGYEVETNSNRYLTFSKPRDTANVTNAVVRTQIGNYVEVKDPYGIPNFTSNLIDVNLYNQYTATPGSAAGTLVGNAKIRGFESPSSNAMLTASTFNTFLFDINMNSGYTFERDVKQLYHASVSDAGYVSPAFTANIVPSTSTVVTGSVTLTNASNSVVGVNSLFTSDLKTGDYIQFSSDTSNSYRVVSLTTNTDLTIDRVYPLANVAGVNATRDDAVIVDNDKSSYIFPMPNDVIKELSDITIRTRRVFYGTLSSNVIALSTAAGSTFASRTDQDYFAVAVTGGTIGKIYQIQSDEITFTDAPTNRNISIDLTDYGLTNQDVLVYTTIIKNDPTAKSKTSTTSTTTLTDKNDCQAVIVSLGVADAYELSNVRMSANAFGTAYQENNSIDITDYYTLETGQTSTYYGISKVKLKPGKPAPVGPIKIQYKYFTHGTGDYFSAESYPDYDNIPVFKDQGIVYSLRDSIDLRPRISNDGLNFKNTGAVRNEFLDYASDFQTDYSYYLPRTDKIYITPDGKVTYKEGVSSLNPVEPLIPGDAMPLFVIEHPAYGFNINRDSIFYSIDQKRYTMKDIGKLENRIKNLEYYTTLSLLELDTAVFSIKDEFGLSRFKNGFVVESFKGHGIGDVRNLDYNISMDFENGELKPAFFQENYKLVEQTPTEASRTSNGYVIKNNTAMLQYEDVPYIFNEFSSSTESINPYDNFTFTGSMALSPPGDTWFSTSEKPLIYRDDTGAYDTFIPDSVGEATYGSVWGAWKQFWYSPTNNDAVKAVQGGVVITDASATGSSTNAVFPFVRSASIRFTAKKLKPNTKMYAFFNEYNVTDYCKSANTTSNVTFTGDYFTNSADIITDETGSVTGTFNYNLDINSLRIPAGSVKFRLTDSPTNGNDKESFADAIYNANGTLTYTEPPRVTYNPPVVSVSAPSSPPTNTPVPVYEVDPYVPDGGDPGIGPQPPHPPIDGTTCPSPEMNILMADGTFKHAGSLTVGDIVKTQHENTFVWGDYPVTYCSIIPEVTRVKIKFNDIEFIGSYDHKFYIDASSSWVTARDIKVGDVVSDKTVIGIEEHITGPVVQITIEDAHTYICQGLLSHNKSPPEPFPPRPPVIALDYIVVSALYNEGAGADYSWASSSAVAQAYRDAVATYAAERGSSLTVIQNAAINTPNGYDFNREVVANDGGTQYNFHSGPAIAILNPSSALADPNYILPNGLTVDNYLTATNILSATDGSGSSFTERVASVTSADFNTTVVPIFEATKETVSSIVAAGTPTADMLSFWEVGLANGSFSNTEEGIQAAVANYAAAITLSIIEDGASGNSAWDTLRDNGVASSYDYY